MDGKKKSLHQGRVSGRIGKLLEERTAGAAPRDALRGLASALIAFLLGNCALPFATYPLGLALLCASTDKTLYVAAGLIAASFTLPLPWVLPLSVTLGTLGVRILARIFIDLPARIGGDGRRGELWEHLRGRLFCEGLYLRMACVCVSVFAMSLYAIIGGGFRYYDLFGALFSMVVAPVAVFLFSGLFEGEVTRLFEGRAATAVEHLSHIAMAVTLCYALDGTALAGIPLAVTFAFVATLALCRRRGLVPSALGGLLCGLVLDLPYALIFAVTAIAAYCILDVSPMLAASVACIAGTVCGILLLGSGAMSSVFLPLFSGTAVYCTAEKLLRRTDAATVPHASAHGGTSSAHLQAQTESALRLADTLTELSTALSSLSKRQKKPSTADLRLLCDACFDRLCPSCTARADCWEKRYHTMLDSLDSLAATLAEKGRVTAEELPVPLARDCLAVEHLLTLVNEGAAELTMSSVCSEKAEIFALDYTASATLLRELCSACEANFREDDKNAAAIASRMKDLGYAAADVRVTGERQKRITVSGMSVLPERSRLSYLGGQLSRVCGFPLSAPQLDADGTLTVDRANAIEVSFGSNFSAREGVCGDVISVFRDDERGILCAILNDGMGAGKEAAFTAQLASLFLRKLLPAGVRAETALRMLNHFLRLGRNRGSTESSTTVDLLMLDLIESRAVFLKSGAAPTYVKRGKNIFYLDSGTAPVGILPEIDAKQIDFEVRDGDIIVMVSDGITGGDSECLWLLDYLDATNHEDPTILAEHIVADAAEHGNADDLSAIVLRIKSKNFQK